MNAHTATRILASPTCQTDEPLVIVGSGPVGVRLVEELIRRGFSAPIILFGEEPWLPYNRVKLSSLLAGEISLEHIQHSPAIPPNSRLIQHLACPITAINTSARTVTDVTGAVHGFSRLVLAVGSRAHVPAIAGLDLAGVYRFRDLGDTASLLARTARSRHIVVAGGGLLGVEGARALLRAGSKVTIVQRPEHLMDRQLDAHAAGILQRRLEAQGIEVITGQGIATVLGDAHVAAVRLRQGDLIACDTVLFATGIRPNIELAIAARLTTRLGIRVDDQLQTSHPDVFAIGECAEHRGQVYGLVLPGYEQAAVLADRLTGGSAQYFGSISVTQLKVLEQPVFSCGEVVELPRRFRQSLLHWEDRDKGSYRKIVLHRGRLIGALAMGPCAENRRLQEAIQYRRRISLSSRLRFRLSGNLWAANPLAGVADWPEAAMVCQCMGINRGLLSAALPQCDSVAALSAATGAATVCGSCKPLLQELLGKALPAEASPLAPALMWLAGISLLLWLLWLSLPGLAVSGSFSSGMWLERLWNNSLSRQISGFTLLGLSLLTLAISLRKRVRRVTLGPFDLWRLLHVALGLTALLTLFLHTGLHAGVNLNRWLLIDFLALIALGAMTAAVIAAEHQLSARQATRLRSGFLWAHLLATWPFPVLLSFHILSVYFFQGA